MEEEDFKKSVECLENILKNIKDLLTDIKEDNLHLNTLDKIKEDVKTIHEFTTKIQ
jgi:hypothetical protein